MTQFYEIRLAEFPRLIRMIQWSYGISMDLSTNFILQMQREIAVL